MVSSLHWSFMTIFNSILHVVSEKKIIKNFSQSEALWPLAAMLDLSDRNESNNTWLDHANEHSCHVWSHLLQWFSRRRLKCLWTDGGRQVMAIAHMTLWVRWTKNWPQAGIRLYSRQLEYSMVYHVILITSSWLHR